MSDPKPRLKDILMGLVPATHTVGQYEDLDEEEAEALLVALLRARPDVAVRAVDTARVLRGWRRTERESYRARLNQGPGDGLRPRVYGVTDGAWIYGDKENTSREAMEVLVDADMLTYGAVLAEVTGG